MAKVHAPIHPGEILLEEFMKPYGISQYEVAKVIGVSPRRINEIVHGKRSITADTGLRLARAFSMNDAFFSGLQADYDLEVERDRLDETLDQISVLPAVAKQLTSAN
ncbi:MAG: HigA family addiction module antitoxin [Micrococcales bacterium]